MKNRILSFVLAVVMVFAMIPAVAIGSNAADGLGIKISLSNYTVAPGGTAYVDLYASVDNLAGNDGLCNFQVYFDLPEGVTIAESGYTIYSEGTKGVYSTVNVNDNMIGGTADAGEFLVTVDQLTAKGGALLATVAFNVTGDEGAVYDIIATKVSDFAMRSEEGDTKPSDADLGAAKFVGGKITVATVATGAADAYEGNGETYAIPSVNAAGQTVVKVNAAGKMTGSFDTLIVPVTATVFAYPAISAAQYNAIALKNTQYEKMLAGISEGIKSGEISTLYYHKRTNSADTTVDTIKKGIKALEQDYYDNYGEEIEYNVALKNIMSAGAVVDGSTVTFYGNIVIEDVKYQDVFVEAVFTVDGEDRIFTTEKDPETNKYVYTTLTSGETVLVTTDEAVSVAGGTYVDGAYLFGGVINNVPAEVLSTLRVTAYGRTWDANGNLIYVCSDVWTPAA